MTTDLIGPTVVLVISSLQISAGAYCSDNIFLRVGTRGVVSCDFGVYGIVGWLNSTTDLETTRPFIYREGSEIHQPESGEKEYSMLPNGSLVIKNVTLDHEKNYTVRVFKNGAVTHHEVPVKVYVLPIPEYPVVNGMDDQTRVVVHSSNGKASFNCGMDHVKPAVPLELVFVSPISSSISMTTIPSTLNNHDGTYNVSLYIQLTLNLPNGIYFSECRAAESLAHLFTSLSVIDLSVFDGRYNFPLVNGLVSQQHVVLNLNRDGTLNCSMNRVSQNVNLEWNSLNSYSLAEVDLERQAHSSLDNGDGTYNVTSITRYKAIGESVQYALLKCMVSGLTAHLYPLFTTVELNFLAADRRYNFPLVNGLESQQHVVLDVKREGALNCSMKRVSPNVDLEWKYINHDSLAEIALERQSQSSVGNGDGTYEITLISRYKTTGESLQRVTLKCVVSGEAANFYPLFTTVELHFPVVDCCNTTSVWMIIIIGSTCAMVMLFVVFVFITRGRIRLSCRKRTMIPISITNGTSQYVE